MTMLARCGGSACAALLLFAGTAAGQMAANGHRTGGYGTVTVEAAWARASVGRNGAAYFTIVNRGSADDRLTGVATDAAKRAMLHATKMENNVMRMRKLDGMAIPAGHTVTLKPGGSHVMMVGLTRKLEEGQQFPLTLTFEKAGEMTVTVPVKGAGAMGAGGMDGHGGMKH